MLSFPLSLSGLLHGCVLDYGTPLFYVITKASNSIWQLRPGLGTLSCSSFEYSSLSVISFISQQFFPLSLSSVSQTCFQWCGNKPEFVSLFLSSSVYHLLKIFPHSGPLLIVSGSSLANKYPIFVVLQKGKCLYGCKFASNHFGLKCTLI